MDKDQTTIRCAECGEPLSGEHRYCLNCGTRRGPLPDAIAQRIAALFERGHWRRQPPGEMEAAAPAEMEAAAPAEMAAPADPEAVEPPDEASSDPWVVTPRAAAAAVIGMLGFGVVLGAMVGGGEAAAFRRVIVDIPHSQGQAATGSGLAGGAASPAAQVRTVTIVSGSPVSQVAAAGAGASQTPPPASGAPAGPAGPLPPIKHVFLITLSQQGYQQSFGTTSNDPYLAGTLTSQGELVQYYYAVAWSPLANEIAMVSGQGPTPQTIHDCPTYGKIVPGKGGSHHQILGHGCVYPKPAQTLADQLTQAKQTWKAYLQTAPSGGTTAWKAEACAPKLGHSPKSGHGRYAAWLNPFFNFQSTAKPGVCSKNMVSLSKLAHDLKSPKTTPTLSYIVPDLCDDGNSTPCQPHAAHGLKAADAFLKSVVPKIEASPAYKAGGLIAITFDEAPQSGPNADSSSCCQNPTYPNAPAPKKSSSCGSSTTSSSPSSTTTSTSTTNTSSTTTTTTTSSSSSSTPSNSCPSSSSGFGGGGSSKATGGGGQVGLLLISPYIVPGTLDLFDSFNHYSLLGSVEQIFGLKRLGYAGASALPLFAPAMFKNYQGCAKPGKAPPC